MNEISIKKKLILSYLAVVFTPVLLVGLFLGNSLSDMAVKHATEQSMNNIEKNKRRIEEILKTATDISNKIYFDRNLKKLIQTSYASDLDVFLAYSGYTDFTDYLQLHDEIAGIRFYTENASLLNNWTFLKLDAATKNAGWFKDALQNRGRFGWYYIPDATKQNRNYLSLVREIFNDDMSLCGMLVLTLNPQYLSAAVSQEPYETMIVTDRDDVIAANDAMLVNTSVKSLKLNHDQAGDEPVVKQINYRGEEAKLITDTIQLEYSNNSLELLSIVPLQAILKESRHVNAIAYAVILSSLVLSVALILFFSGALTKRIRRLSKDIRLFALGVRPRISIAESKDEIGQLTRHINFMIRSIDSLIGNVEEAHLQKNALLLKQKEINFKMLASQINPHFLFNVLETIRMKAQCSGEAEIADTVKTLGKLLRHILETGHEPIPLVREMHVVRAYLDIQKFRFEDKLDYELPEDAQMEGLSILPMIVQPIVENAIVHGVENKLGVGRLRVTIERSGGRCRIAVADNGNGIEPSKREDIMRALDQTEAAQDQRIGLRNVHQRLRLHFGPDYGLDIVSEKAAGTSVIIIVPDEGGVNPV